MLAGLLAQTTGLLDPAAPLVDLCGSVRVRALLIMGARQRRGNACWVAAVGHPAGCLRKVPCAHGRPKIARKSRVDKRSQNLNSPTTVSDQS